MEQPIKINKFSYFDRSRLRLRPQEIWERDYQTPFIPSRHPLFLSHKKKWSAGHKVKMAAEAKVKHVQLFFQHLVSFV